MDRGWSKAHKKLVRLTDRWRVGRQDREILRLMRETGFFDRDYYLKANPDVASGGIDPEFHYLKNGRREGRSPSAIFNPQAYFRANPDLADAGVDPVIHYLRYGRAEGRRTQTDRQLIAESGLFDAEFYRTLYPDVARSGQDPLEHYMDRGRKERRQPSLNFDPAVYLMFYPDVERAGMDPIMHYIQNGRAEGRQCRNSWFRSEQMPAVMKKVSDSGLFDGEYYTQQFPGLRDASVNPLLHYLVSGFGDWLDPSARFLTLHYQNAHPEVRKMGMNPLLHFLGVEIGEERIPMPGDLVRRERTGGEAFLARYGSGSGKHTQGAIKELADRWPGFLVRESEPDVSIIISGGELDYILNCLDSLSRQHSRFPAEILVDSQRRELEAIPWIQRCASDVRTSARGRFLVFLRGNTRVAEGWLDELVGSFEVFPKAGCVESSTDDSDCPKDSFARQVEPASNVAFAVPADRHLRGNDELVRRIREASYEVWLQPLARVVDYGGEERSEPIPAEQHVLVLDEVTPMPDNDSGSFITIRILRALQELGYQVTFVPQRSYSFDPSYTSALQRIGVECLYAPFFRDIGQVLELRTNFSVVLAFRFDVLNEVYAEIRQNLPDARLIFHNVDLHFLREEREAALLGDDNLRAKAALTKATELDLITKVDCTIVHTKAERDIIGQDVEIDNIIEFPYVAEVHRTQVAFEDRHDVVFLGNFKHPPNIDAVKYFATSLWPILERKLPEEARFVIVGPAAPDEVKELTGPRISLTGHVADLREAFERARVFVAPLRYGAGIKGKVIQSLCYGTPSVVTPIAAEGIGLTSGRETIIALDDFAEQVLRLYFDERLWSSLQTAGYEFVEKNFSWSRCLELCAQALKTADATRIRRRRQASGGQFR